MSSTPLHLSDADFLNGTLRFQPVAGAGAIVNEGTLRTTVGGPIYLVGPTVTNGLTGVIDNVGGEVILVAGNSVELANAGTPGLTVAITAPDNQALNLGNIFVDTGSVSIFGGLVTQGGMLTATSAVLGADGSIRLVATDTTTIAAGSFKTFSWIPSDFGATTLKNANFTCTLPPGATINFVETYQYVDVGA